METPPPAVSELDSEPPSEPASPPARPRLLFLALAFIVAAAFFLATHRYWVPADPNVDENAYLVSGRLLAQTGSTGFVPPDPYYLVGPMWISTPEGRFYPKYPLGETLLVAAAIKTFGLPAAFLVNPLLMTLALFGIFLLVGETVGPLAGLLAMLAMAMSPVLLAETNDPDSHASSLCFTTWGMLLLLRWWRAGRRRDAALAGLLLGLSTITRYTEGLLLLPVALVALFRLWRPQPGPRWDRRSLAGTAALALGWLLPVAGQVAFNLRTLHSLTGYDTTNESTAFSPAYFAHNWRQAVSQLFTLGLPLLLPLAVLGLALLAVRERRLGLVLWAWALPNLLLYMFYYWAVGDVTYIRFFLTSFPPLVLGMAWLLTRPLPSVLPPADRLPRWVRPAVALGLVLGCGAFGVRRVLPILESNREDQQQAANAGAAVSVVAPAGAVFFGPQQALLFLQYALPYSGDYRLYSRALFAPRMIARLGNVDLLAPNTLQPQRARALYRLLKNRNGVQLLQLERAKMAGALDQGRKVFLIAPVGEPAWSRFAAHNLDARDGRSFDLRPAGHWTGWQEAGPGVERKPMDWQLLEVTVRPAPAAGPG